MTIINQIWRDYPFKCRKEKDSRSKTSEAVRQVLKLYFSPELLIIGGNL
jgi:hypothetical protein